MENLYDYYSFTDYQVVDCTQEKEEEKEVEEEVEERKETSEERQLRLVTEEEEARRLYALSGDGDETPLPPTTTPMHTNTNTNTNTNTSNRITAMAIAIGTATATATATKPKPKPIVYQKQRSTSNNKEQKQQQQQHQQRRREEETQIHDDDDDDDSDSDSDHSAEKERPTTEEYSRSGATTKDYVTAVHPETDILPGCRYSVGNQVYRKTVRDFRSRFNTNKEQGDRPRVSQLIVEHIQTVLGGRFLKTDTDAVDVTDAGDYRWYLMPRQEALNKVFKALGDLKKGEKENEKRTTTTTKKVSKNDNDNDDDHTNGDADDEEDHHDSSESVESRSTASSSSSSHHNHSYVPRNTSRWTAREHETLVEGIATYGISRRSKTLTTLLLPTRSVSAVENYLKRNKQTLVRDAAARKGSPPNKKMTKTDDNNNNDDDDDDGRDEDNKCTGNNINQENIITTTNDHDTETGSRRSSNRKRIPTTMEVNGRTVLKQNNFNYHYDQENGDNNGEEIENDNNDDNDTTTPSVSSSTKKRKRKRSSTTSISSTTTSTQNQPKRKKHWKKPNAARDLRRANARASKFSAAASHSHSTSKAKSNSTTTTTPTTTTTTTTSAAIIEMKRQIHNETVLTRKATKQPCRLDFFAHHLGILRPFCTSEVLEVLYKHTLQQKKHRIQKKKQQKKAKSVKPKNKNFEDLTDDSDSDSDSDSDEESDDEESDSESSAAAATLSAAVPTTPSSPSPSSLFVLEQQPTLLDPAVCTLCPYQRQGLEFMIRRHQHNVPMILGDEDMVVGGGKIVQTIALLCYLKESNEQITGPSLILCPTETVVSNWCHGMDHYAPTLEYYQFVPPHHPNEQHITDATTDMDMTQYDVIVTTYDRMANTKVPSLMKGLYQRIHFNYLIVDEGGGGGGGGGGRQLVRTIECENTLLLTGSTTPLFLFQQQGRSNKGYAIFNALYPDIFTTKIPFFKTCHSTKKNEDHKKSESKVDDTQQQQGGGEGEEKEEITSGRIRSTPVDKSRLLQTEKLLHLFMLRRMRKDVEHELSSLSSAIPQVPVLNTDHLIQQTKVVFCPLSRTQLFWYKALLLKDRDSLEKMMTTTTTTTTSRMTMQRQLQMDNTNNATTVGATTATTVTSSTLTKNRKNGNNNNNEGNSSNNQNKNNTTMCSYHHRVLRELFQQLRKCSNHPFLFEGVAETTTATTDVQEVIRASGKLAVLDMLLQSLFRQKKTHKTKHRRVVVVTQGTLLLDVIENYCVLRGWKYGRIDGRTERARKNYLLRRYNEHNSPYFLLLLSTPRSLSSSCGGRADINLQTADTVILYDSDWKHQDMARVHRIGQTKTVHVYRLISSGTVEERMIQRATMNIQKDDTSDGDGDGDKSYDTVVGCSGSNVQQLLHDIIFSCEAIVGRNAARTNIELPSKEDIDAVTNRSYDSITRDSTLPMSMSALAEAAPQIISDGGGIDFYGLRKEEKGKERKQIPKNLKDIVQLWKNIKSSEGKKKCKRTRETPIIQGDGNKGLMKKKRPETQHDNEDDCYICGEGGLLVCCPRCPNSAHLSCIGLTHANQFKQCSHHHCTVCLKNLASAGGILFPCQCCDRAYCVKCLPKKGVSFLDKVDRYEKLGFDTTKNVVYINCKPECEEYARKEFGYDPARETKVVCPKELDFSKYFGMASNIDNPVGTEDDQESVKAERHVPIGKSPSVCKYPTNKKKVVKICQHSAKIVGQYKSVSEAARSIGVSVQNLSFHMNKFQAQEYLFHGCYWRFQSDLNQTLDVENDHNSYATLANTTTKQRSNGKHGKKIVKICMDTAEVVDQFLSVSTAAQSVGTSGNLLSSHMKKSPAHPYKGFYWQYKSDPNQTLDVENDDNSSATLVGMTTKQDGRKIRKNGILKICMHTAEVVDQFLSVLAAAQSVETSGPKLSYHMRKSPAHPYKGFYWRFPSDSDQTLQTSPTVDPTVYPAAKKISKICTDTGEVVGHYDSISSAAKTITFSRTHLSLHMQNSPSHPLAGFYWRFEMPTSISASSSSSSSIPPPKSPPPNPATAHAPSSNLGQPGHSNISAHNAQWQVELKRRYHKGNNRTKADQAASVQKKVLNRKQKALPTIDNNEKRATDSNKRSQCILTTDDNRKKKKSKTEIANEVDKEVYKATNIKTTDNRPEVNVHQSSYSTVTPEVIDLSSDQLPNTVDELVTRVDELVTERVHSQSLPNPARKREPSPILSQIGQLNTSMHAQRVGSKADIKQLPNLTRMPQMIDHRPMVGQLPNIRTEIGTQGGYSYKDGLPTSSRGMLQMQQQLLQQISQRSVPSKKPTSTQQSAMSSASESNSRGMIIKNSGSDADHAIELD